MLLSPVYLPDLMGQTGVTALPKSNRRFMLLLYTLLHIMQTLFLKSLNFFKNSAVGHFAAVANNYEKSCVGA